MAVRDDDIGLCPATLLVDPMQIDDARFEAAARAAAGAGFAALSLWSFWVTAYGTERARALLDSLGLRAAMVEAVTGWIEGPGERLDAELDAVLAVTTGLGADMLLACTLEPELPSVADAAAGFAAVCARAADHGVRVSIEFLPYSGVPDLATAWQVVEGSGASNGGILVDMMHWQHQPGGPDFALLEQLPGERIHAVQVCDTTAARPPADRYLTDALAQRQLPGEGAVDIPRLLTTFDAIGAEPWFAYEVFNADLARQGPDATANRVKASSIG